MSNNIPLHLQSIKHIQGIGPSIEDKLFSMGIKTVYDILFHLPIRYQDRSKVQPIGSIKKDHFVVIEGEIRVSDIIFNKRRNLLCKIQDQTGTITLRFFNFNKTQKNSFRPGIYIRCFGKTSISRGGLEMIHPEYEFINKDSLYKDSEYLTAIYSTTEGLSQKRWRKFISSAFELIKQDEIPELLTKEHLSKIKNNVTTDIYKTLKLLHYPPVNTDCLKIIEGNHPYQRRLAFEELISHRLSFRILKNKLIQSSVNDLYYCENLEREFIKNLPFSLTKSQYKVLHELKSDLNKKTPMLRLLQGDVGSGKTVIGALLAIQCIKNKKQVALMAPTEILAEQHLNTFLLFFEKYNVNACLLTSKVNKRDKETILNNLSSGKIDIVIGTHAIIQDSVKFSDLGLVIIDEQHRFGVEQRRILKNKTKNKKSVHQLIMTATPIPRTLAMTFYADLDYSIIDELPPGRKEINTIIVSNDRRKEVIDRIKNACNEGKQVYWICTLVEESETLQCQAAESTAEILSKNLTDINVGLVHGRLKSDEKTQIMSLFKSGDIQLLVATTVVEVGVDVPNASLIVIENPERLGLSQLHQLRGRVGRGEIQSHCVLMYQKPISKNAKERLTAMRETNDGFLLAEKDLALRGAGEMLGTKQSGEKQFRIAKLERDMDMIDGVVHVSEIILNEDLNKANELISRWCPLAENYIDV